MIYWFFCKTLKWSRVFSSFVTIFDHALLLYFYGDVSVVLITALESC